MIQSVSITRPRQSINVTVGSNICPRRVFTRVINFPCKNVQKSSEIHYWTRILKESYQVVTHPILTPSDGILREIKYVLDKVLSHLMNYSSIQRTMQNRFGFISVIYIFTNAKSNRGDINLCLCFVKKGTKR